MTKERREEVVLVALVLSLAIHAGLMFLVKAQVMSARPSFAEKVARRVPLHVRKVTSQPDPLKIAELEDLVAPKDAPAAVGDVSAPRAESPVAESAGRAAVEVKPSVPEVKLPEAKPQFETKPLALDSVGAPVLPMTRIETPTMGRDVAEAPEFSIKMPDLAKVSPVALPAAKEAADLFGVAKMSVGEPSAAGTFTPSEEVYEKVDEKVVATEKAAVRELVDSATAADLVKFVNLTMTATAADGWRYFKVMMTPRSTLKTVPKDVVILIDGSGSIGNDRFGGCRKAARRIMRSCMNTGDRFNLVVFRNAFSYAFRNWRECDAASFEAADKWLGRETAHGRTDVFSTIRSVLTLPRDPTRPLVALVVTDGDANSGVSDTADILSKFTALNDGLVSVYMYGVKSSANRELIDVLTHGNRGESFIFDGWRWNSGEGMEALSERFRDPVLSDLRVVFASGSRAEAYPRLLRNLYRGGTLEFVGRVPVDAKDVAFSLKGLNGAAAYESFFRLPFATAPSDPSVVADWKSEAAIARKFH